MLEGVGERAASRVIMAVLDGMIDDDAVMVSSF